MRKICLFLTLTLISLSLLAQKKTAKEYKNTVKYNVLSPLIFGKNCHILGYERVMKPNQTLNVNAGLTSLPRLVNVNGDSVNLLKDASNTGFHFSAEYRFYLGKWNKFQAPRGIYLAPYYSYNSFKKGSEWSVNKASFNGQVNTDFALNVNTLGVEMGYQFVFWDRLSLDFIFLGPGLSLYQLKTDVNTSLSVENQSELLRKINQLLSNKIPGYNLVLPEKETSASIERRTISSFNFRYQIQLGFRF